jgi:hypothetical protein
VVERYFIRFLVASIAHSIVAFPIGNGPPLFAWVAAAFTRWCRALKLQRATSRSGAEKLPTRNERISANDPLRNVQRFGLPISLPSKKSILALLGLMDRDR